MIKALSPSIPLGTKAMPYDRSPDRASPAATGTDPRISRSRASILDAATALLSERGFSGVSMDEISRRSGVAKTTIYRHWSDRDALLRDACIAVGRPQQIPDTGRLDTDLETLLTELADGLQQATWASILPSVIDAAERDPATAAMYAELQQGYVQPFQVVLGRAIARGELPDAPQVDTLIAALIGPLFYRRWFSREALGQSFIAAHLQQVLRGIRYQPARPASSQI